MTIRILQLGTYVCKIHEHREKMQNQLHIRNVTMVIDLSCLNEDYLSVWLYMYVHMY